MEPTQIIELVGGPDDGLLIQIPSDLDFGAIWLPRTGLASLFDIANEEVMTSKYVFDDFDSEGVKKYRYDKDELKPNVS